MNMTWNDTLRELPERENLSNNRKELPRMSQGRSLLGKIPGKSKHFFCNLELGGMGEVSLQHGELLEALSGVFILGEEKLLQCVSLKDCNKSIINES